MADAINNVHPTADELRRRADAIDEWWSGKCRCGSTRALCVTCEQTVPAHLNRSITDAVPPGYHLNSITWDNDSGEAFAQLEGDDEPWPWVDGTGPTPEAAIADARGKVK